MVPISRRKIFSEFTTENNLPKPILSSLVLPPMSQRQSKKILKQDPAVTRFVWVLPTGAALVPVFERFFEVKLHRINQLVINAANHHLIATEVRSCQQPKAVGNAIQLQSVILPNAQDAGFLCIVLPYGGFGIAQPAKDWIARLRDPAPQELVLFQEFVW